MLDNSDSHDGTAERGRRPRRAMAGSGAATAPARQWPQVEGEVRRPERRRDGEGDAGKVMIELSKSQVDQVVRGAGEGGTMSILLSALRDPDWTLAVDSEDWSYPEQMEDRRL